MTAKRDAYFGGWGWTEVDLALRETAPDPRLPCLVWVFVEAKSSGPLGNPTEDDLPELSAIEAALCFVFEPQGAVLAGVIREAFCQQYYFYLPGAGDFESNIESAMRGIPDCPYECGSCSDPQWSEYLGILYPSPYKIHFVKSSPLGEQIDRSKDIPKARRMISYLVYFADFDAKEEFSKWAIRDGFAAKDANREDFSRSFPWGVWVSKEGSLISFATSDVARKAEELNGIYEGWTAPVVTEAPPPTGRLGKLFGTR